MAEMSQQKKKLGEVVVESIALDKSLKIQETHQKPI